MQNKKIRTLQFTTRYVCHNKQVVNNNPGLKPTIRRIYSFNFYDI